ncbi:MAG: glycosyltransferase [Gemmatimonadetes bacterium]|nr:glycosyltransferase [Gemmatimonadota bacterium]
MIPPSPLSGICVVTVTYGHRGHLLAQALAAVRAQSTIVGRIVVVANGPTDSLAALRSGAADIELVELDRNYGSAAGFKRGLEAAHRGSWELIWLLDDDNRPRSDALAQLLAARQSMGANEKDCFASLRTHREKHLAAARGDRPLEVYPNSFLRFDIGRAATRLFHKAAPSRFGNGPPAPAPAIRKVDYAIFGGLLLHRGWIDRIGYPDEAYWTYMDDVDYTTRIVRAGGSIYLVASSVIEDLDHTWGADNRGNGSPLADPDVNEQRLFYTVRNNVFLENRYFVTRRWRYLSNVAITLGAMFVSIVLRSRSPVKAVRRCGLALRAIRDGLAGRMGIREGG